MSVRNLKRHYILSLFSNLSSVVFYTWVHYLKWWDICMGFGFTCQDLIYTYQPKYNYKTYNSKPYLFPSTLNSKDRTLFDTTLLKIPSRTSTFGSWNFHTRSWTKLWIKNCQSLLHLKQNKKVSGTDFFFSFFIQKLSCLPALWIYDKGNFWVFCCLLPVTVSGRENWTDWESLP